jgi:hypothetical protein
MGDAYEARLMDVLALMSDSYDARPNGSTSEISSTPRLSLRGRIS